MKPVNTRSLLALVGAARSRINTRLYNHLPAGSRRDAGGARSGAVLNWRSSCPRGRRLGSTILLVEDSPEK